MQVKSIAECSKVEHSATLSTFIKLLFVINIFALSILSGRFRQGLLIMLERSIIHRYEVAGRIS